MNLVLFCSDTAAGHTCAVQLEYDSLLYSFKNHMTRENLHRGDVIEIGKEPGRTGRREQGKFR